MVISLKLDGILSKEHVSILLETDAKGKTALDWARLAKKYEVARFLERVSDLQRTPTSTACGETPSSPPLPLPLSVCIV